MRTSPFRILALALIVILLSSCATAGKVADQIKLPSLGTIATPENAARALVIAQAIRVEQRDHLARRVSADGVIDIAEQDSIARFHERDTRFTDAWAKANAIVTAWKASGAGRPVGFDSAYEILLSIAQAWADDALVIKPVVVEGGQ